MAMSARQREILAEARATLAKRDRTSSSQPEVVYKRHDDAVVERSAAVASGGSEEPWWQRVENYVDTRIMELAEDAGKQTWEWLAEVRREVELLRRELAVVRGEVAAVERLRDLQNEVAEARAEVPKVPAIVDQLEAKQSRLERELAKTRTNSAPCGQISALPITGSQSSTRPRRRDRRRSS